MFLNYQFSVNCDGHCSENDFKLICTSHGLAPCYASYLIQECDTGMTLNNCTTTDTVISNMLSDRGFMLEQTQQLYPLGEDVNICITSDTSCYLYEISLSDFSNKAISMSMVMIIVISNVIFIFY